MKFVLFHGAFSGAEGNWFPELKEKFEALGQTVITPQFPVDTWNDIASAGLQVQPKHQSLENWLASFKDIISFVKPNDRLCFVGHSLGPLFILHVVDKFNILR